MVNCNSASIGNNEDFKSHTGGLIKKVGISKKLLDLEKRILGLAPLEISYDVNRPQKNYFDEFTYTELLGGGIFVSPMSTQIACELTHGSISNNEVFSVEEMAKTLLSKISSNDKYIEMKEIDTSYSDVVILCGSNLIWKHVSKELLVRTMHENPNAVIKPHPLTSDEDIRTLGIQIGKSRILDKYLSGHDLVSNASNVWDMSTSQLGIYAHILGKNVDTVGNFFEEHDGAYYPLYSVGRKSRKELLSCLLNPFSGVFFEDTTDIEIQEYFEKTMELREANKPLSSHYYKG